ncbi:MAG: nucleotidyl transferase AbiEii/AbiGii toxin family protein [Candidatus Sumerlaeaceae bacterium]|nr:nucleotidyl transferase AbiEii/AbiGii toxin family protein [Candidatus Sumerlaeaceae bacterium]
MENLESLAAAIRDTSEWLAKPGRQGMIIGGVAFALNARPRLTQDVDATVLAETGEDEEIESLTASAAANGLFPRIDNLPSFAAKSLVLLMVHRKSNVEVDIALGFLPFEREAFSRSRVDTSMGFPVRIPAPEDHIVMKAVANRPHDWADIAMITEYQPTLDKPAIMSRMRSFTEILDCPERLEKLAQVLGVAYEK